MSEPSLSTVLDRNTIVTDLAAHSKDDVIASLTQLLLKQGHIEQQEAFVAAVHEREQEGATGIGGHVAIPHGRSDTVRKNGMAIAILRNEIPWESLDETGAKAVVLFTVGANDDGAQEHLKLLSMFARKLAKSQVVEALLHARSADDVIAAFAD